MYYMGDNLVWSHTLNPEEIYYCTNLLEIVSGAPASNVWKQILRASLGGILELTLQFYLFRLAKILCCTSTLVLGRVASNGRGIRAAT